MKVILRDNLETLGQAGDIVSVKDGYARNFLIPRSLAYPATKSNLRAWEDEKRKIIVRISKEMKEAEGVKAELEQVSIVVPMQVGEEGRLFGSVTNRIVADHLKEKNFDIDHRHIVIEEPIRSLGEHEIAVRLVHGVTATVKVTVIAENVQEAPAEPSEDAVADTADEPSEGDPPEQAESAEGENQ